MVDIITAFTKRFTGVSLFAYRATFITLLCAVLVAAPSICEGAPKITFRNNITFDDMEPGEIFSSGSSGQSADEGSFSPEVSWDGTVSESGFESGDLEQVYNQLTFTRWTNNTQSNRAWLWRFVWRKSEHPNPPSISVTFTVEDQFGASGRLTHQSDSGSWLESTVIDTDMEDISNNNRWRFTGTARLEFDISNARRSGRYGGILRTTLTYL